MYIIKSCNTNTVWAKKVNVPQQQYCYCNIRVLFMYHYNTIQTTITDLLKYLEDLFLVRYRCC